MVRRSGFGRDESHEARGGFPLVVAGFSTVVALALFGTSTVKAIEEQELLREVETRRQLLRVQTREQLMYDALHRNSLQYDVQSVLVELDRRGVYPGTILSQVFPFTSEDDRR